MSGELFQTIKLANGLTLEIWNFSRILAGDRWLVSLEVRIEIPVEADYLESVPEKKKVLSLIEKTFGSNVTYRYKQERYFVSQDQKQAIFVGVLDTLKKNKLAYLSHPDFAKRLVLSKYRDLKKKNPQLFL